MTKLAPFFNRGAFDEWMLEVKDALAEINMPLDEWQAVYPFDFEASFAAGTSALAAAGYANTHYWAEQEKRTPIAMRRERRGL